MTGVPSVTSGLSAALNEGPTGETPTSAVHVLQQVCTNLSASSSAECALLALLALVYADEIDSAQAWCDKIAVTSGKAAYALTPLWKAVTAAVRAEIALYRGEFPDAAELAAAALTYLTPDGWGVAIGVPLGCLITAKVPEMGRDTGARRTARHPSCPTPCSFPPATGCTTCSRAASTVWRQARSTRPSRTS